MANQSTIYGQSRPEKYGFTPNPALNFTPKAAVTPGRGVPTTSGSVLSAQTQAPVSRVTGGGNSAAPAGNQTLQDNINNQLQGGLSNIDSDYNSYISSLGAQEESVRRGADVATQQVESAYQPARSSLEQGKVQALASYDTQAQQANKQSKSAMQQARDLYRQLQQQNVAQLSGAGLSSSSVAEALAENLGVETARRIAGVTGSRDEVLQNIEKEKTNVETYTNQKLSELENQLAVQKSSIQSQLLDQISQINNARNLAASDRAQRRNELALNAQNAIAQLTANAQNFAQSLQQWQAQNTQKLSQTKVDFSGINNAANAIGSLAQVGLPISQNITNYLNSQGVQVPQGYAPVNVGTLNPNKQEDELTAYLNKYAIQT